MATWINAGKVSEFSGDLKVIEHKDIPIAIFRLPDGFYALEDTCSHEEAFLSEGEMDGDAIECPLHGALFDIRTGKNLSLPAVLPVKSFPVKIENNEIMIQVED